MRSESTQSKLSPDKMKEFIIEMRNSQTSEKIPIDQFRIKIDQATKALVAKVEKKHYSVQNFNTKRWFDPEVSMTKTFSYGAMDEERNQNQRYF